MSKIGLTADEGGDLPQHFIERYQILTVPFRVDLGEMKDLPGNIYQKIREAEKRGLKSFIRTSQPSPGDFLRVFREKLKSFERVISVTITSKHSGTFNSALQARELLGSLKENVALVDSLSLSGGEGLIILKIGELIEEGLKFEEILKKANEIVSKTKLIFILDDPKWAEFSGRISHVLANLLRKFQNIGIRPILGVKNGKIKLVRVRRKVKEATLALFEEFREEISKLKYKKVKVAITHGDFLEGAEKLKAMIQDLKNVEVSFVNFVGEILGGLAGPKALVLSWQYD